MAMNCVFFGPCTGCMMCQKEPKEIGRCKVCKEPIYEDENYYDIHDELIHEDCLSDWAQKYLVEV